MKTTNRQPKNIKLSFRYASTRNLINNKSFVDHSITIVMIIFTILVFSTLQLTAQEVQKKNNKDKDEVKTNNIKVQNSPQTIGDKVTIKDGSTVLFEVENEGSAGSIKLNDAGAVTTSANKLYNNGGSLYWDGSALGSGGGADSINQLTDAKYDGSSLFVGERAGLNDDGTDNNITAIGKDALRNNTSGHHNTVVGKSVMYDNTSGFWNSAFGFGALFANTTGTENCAFGMNALQKNKIGSGNVAFGYYANFYNVNGSNNTSIGYKAGQGSDGLSQSGNVFLGYQAGFSETGSNKLYIENSNSLTPLIWGDFANDEVEINGDFHVTGNITSDGSSPGATEINDLTDAIHNGSSLFLGTGAGTNDDGTNNWNTSVGYNSLSNNLDGERNTALGYSSLQGNTSGTDNVAVGYLSLNNNLTGNYNVSVGREALGANTGSSNTAIGHWALLYNSSGQYNVGIGKSTNTFNQTGSQNTMIGFEAGKGTSFHSKSGNVFIGYQAGLDQISSNKLYIENSNSPTPLIWGDFATDSLKFNGDVHITGNLHVDGNSSSLSIGSSYQGGIIFWLDDTGKHGLIAATADQSLGVYWIKPFDTVTGATGDGIGAGEMNSMLMVSDSRIYSTAAKICTDLVINENSVNYGDWYLPSHDELKLMYVQQAAIGGFSSGFYWSSTELTFEFAKVVDFSTGNPGASFFKSNTTASVRAIRTF